MFRNNIFSRGLCPLNPAVPSTTQVLSWIRLDRLLKVFDVSLSPYIFLVVASFQTSRKTWTTFTINYIRRALVRPYYATKRPIANFPKALKPYSNVSSVKSKSNELTLTDLPMECDQLNIKILDCSMYTNILSLDSLLLVPMRSQFHFTILEFLLEKTLSFWDMIERNLYRNFT